MSRQSWRLKGTTGQKGRANVAGSGMRGAREDSGENAQVVRAVEQIGGCSSFVLVWPGGKDELRAFGRPTPPSAWPPATIPPAASVRCDGCPPGCA